MENYIEVTINKPLYGTFVNIRDTYLRQAIIEGKMLKITIPQGSATVDPKEWIHTGKRTEQVFRIANRPMVLYGNMVPLKDKKVVTSHQMNLL